MFTTFTNDLSDIRASSMFGSAIIFYNMGLFRALNLCLLRKPSLVQVSGVSPREWMLVKIVCECPGETGFYIYTSALCHRYSTGNTVLGDDHLTQLMMLSWLQVFWRILQDEMGHSPTYYIPAMVILTSDWSRGSSHDLIIGL